MDEFKSKTCIASVNENVIVVKFTADPSVKDLVLLFDWIAQYHIDLPRLYDLSSHGMKFSLPELEAIARIALQKLRNAPRAALVAPDDYNYGQCRQYIVFRNVDRETFRVFREKDEALSWLSGGQEH